MAKKEEVRRRAMERRKCLENSPRIQMELGEEGKGPFKAGVMC